MVEHQLPKLRARVRFSSPAPRETPRPEARGFLCCHWGINGPVHHASTPSTAGPQVTSALDEDAAGRLCEFPRLMGAVRGASSSPATRSRTRGRQPRGLRAKRRCADIPGSIASSFQEPARVMKKPVVAARVAPALSLVHRAFGAGSTVTRRLYRGRAPCARSSPQGEPEAPKLPS